MAIAGTVEWEVRTTGNSTNGGGFNVDSAGIDYSQQDAAQLSINDCATASVGSTTLTSVTGGFTAAMVGNMINLSSGTNLTVGIYEITGYTNSNTITLDRAPDDGVGGVSGSVGKVGGALDWPPTSQSSQANHVWIKSGTYTLTSSTTDALYGPMSYTLRTIEGYETTRGDRGTKPVFNTGLITGVTVFFLNSDSTSNIITNIEVDGVSGANSNTGFNFYRQRCFGDSCLAKNCYNGFAGGGGSSKVYNCIAQDCSNYGFGSLNCSFCIAYSCGTGLSGYINSFDHCLAYDCSTGFYSAYNDTYSKCIADNCSTYGFYVYNNYIPLSQIVLTNNAIGIYFRGTYIVAPSIYCYNNTTDASFTGTAAWQSNRQARIDTTSITTSPYVDQANNDYTLNDDATGGQVVRDLFANNAKDIENIFYPDPDKTSGKHPLSRL